MKKNILFLSLIMWIPTTYSNEFSDDFFIDLPVITSASRLTQSVLTSPSAVTVIDRAIIEASGFIEIADIFRLVPGFQVVHADGQTFAVNSHGFSWQYPNRLQILIDGRSTYTSSLSAIDWRTLGIHIEDIERIEVVRGPAASAYGSNSFAGAINIITRTPELDDKLYIKARAGNMGERQLLFRHSATHENLNYRVTASVRENDGFDNARDERDLSDLSFSSKIALTHRDYVEANFSYTHGSVGAPEIGSEGFFLNRDQSLNIWSGDVQWSHLFSENEELKIKFFHNFRDEDDMTSSIPLSNILGITPSDFQFLTGAPDQTIRAGVRTFHANRSDLEFQYSRILDNGIQYVGGAGIRYDALASEPYLTEKGTVSDTSYRIFGNIQIPIQNYLTANVGGLYEESDIEKPHLSPRFSLNGHLSSSQSIRLSFSQAYRIPSLLEKNVDSKVILSNGLVTDQIYTTNKDIKAEKITSYDIGYIGRSARWPITWELKVYKEEYDDLITFARDYAQPDFTNGYTSRPINAAKFTAYGFEGEISYRPKQNSLIRFHFNNGNGTGTHASSINNPPDGSDDQESSRAFVPRQSYGLLAVKDIRSWQFNIGVYRVGAMTWLSAGDEVPAHTRVDFSVIKQMKLSGDKKLTLKFGSQNIGNNHYFEFRNEFIFDPQYYISLSLTEF